MLQLLAETSGQNIVVSDTVQGNVTLRLQNVPWDQALDIVLRTKGLDKRQEGNVIFVAPSEELAAREKQQLEARKAVTELSPGAHRVSAGQLREGLRPGLADQVAGQELAALRSRQRLDRRAHQHTAAAGHGGAPGGHPPAGVRRSTSRCKQVLIEARIVIVNDDFSRELGVRFGGAAVFNHGGSDGLGFVGNQGLDTVPGESGPIIDPNGAQNQRGAGHDARRSMIATWSTCRSRTRPAASP